MLMTAQSILLLFTLHQQTKSFHVALWNDVENLPLGAALMMMDRLLRVPPVKSRFARTIGTRSRIHVRYKKLIYV